MNGLWPKLSLRFSVELSDMNREEDPKLWDLLGRAKGVEPSAFFARNVVRTVRVAKPEKHGLMAWLSLGRVAPALSVAIVLAIAGFTFQMLHHQSSAHRDFTAAELQDSEVAADLDLLASNDDDDDTSLL
jgi:hypothetical protein